MRNKTKNKKEIGKKLLGSILCLSFVISGIPFSATKVHATEAEPLQVASGKSVMLSTDAILNPRLPKSMYDFDWKGNYVYLGNYDVEEDGVAEPVKYRVLDTNTTKYSADGVTQTMFLDCDSVLYCTPFDADGVSNAEGKNQNDWSISDIKNSLNGNDFLNKSTVFTETERKTIAKSTVASHPLTTNSAEGVVVSDWAYSALVNYKELTGEQIFLLDAEDCFNSAYGFNIDYYLPTGKKFKGDSYTYYIRSTHTSKFSTVNVSKHCGIGLWTSTTESLGVSPALNLECSKILFSTPVSGTVGEIGAEYKLTLMDSNMTIVPSAGITKSGSTLTIPYTISGSNKGNASQVSVLVLDKEYTAGNTNGAAILDYQKLNVSAFAATGSGTYTLPDSLTDKKIGVDYHLYILAEDVNETKETDVASKPYEVEIWIDTMKIPGFDRPVAEKAFVSEITVETEGVQETTLPVTWKRVTGSNEEAVTGNAEWKTTYKGYVTLTPEKGYAFKDIAGNKTKISVGTNELSEGVTVNNDGTLTVMIGKYTTATRKITKRNLPQAPELFDEYYTKENILQSAELGLTAQVTMEGTTTPNILDMQVEWQIVDKSGKETEYDATPSAYNTFRWSILSSEYADYDTSAVDMEGITTIQNKKYVPVLAELPTVAERNYHPSKSLTEADITGGVVKDVDGSSLPGTWSFKEQNLIPRVDKATYEVVFTPTDIEHYESITEVITIKVNKTTPVIVAAPVAADIICGKSLQTAVLSGGKAQVSATEAVNIPGTFCWKDATVVPSVNDSNVTKYTVVFTPADSVNFNTTQVQITVRLQAPSKGTKLTSDDGKAIYKITKSDMKKGTVTYMKPVNKKKSSVTIPDTVTIDGVKYIVTAIEKNAFKNNKKIKKLTIGKNVSKIGAKAFYGCKNLKKVTIKTTKLTTRKIGKKAFAKTSQEINIKVPKKKYRTYKSMLIKRGVNKKAKFKKK